MAMRLLIIRDKDTTKAEQGLRAVGVRFYELPEFEDRTLERAMFADDTDPRERG